MADGVHIQNGDRVLCHVPMLPGCCVPENQALVIQMGTVRSLPQQDPKHVHAL
jgi:hypothetical protein